MPHEEGMKLVFDLVERTVVVSFRDTIKILGPFPDQNTAMHAGEQYCGDHGWDDVEDSSSSNSTMSK